MLYNRFENEAGKRGIKHIILEGSPLGEPVYRKFGFREIRTIHKTRKGISYADAVMRKDL